MVQLTTSQSPQREQDIENKWLRIQQTFLLEYRELFPSDLHYRKGEFSDMLDRIGEKLGMTETQLRKKIMKWEDAASHYF